MTGLRLRRRRAEAPAPETTALSRSLIALKADVRDALSKITEADKAIDRYLEEHRGSSHA